jgi:hypothetical protein
MGVSFKQGKFSTVASPGNQDITDVGFQPKAVIIWNTGVTNTTVVEHIIFNYGFADGTNQACVNFSTTDNATTSDTYSNVTNNAIINSFNEAGVEVHRATLTSFLVNGFRLNFSVSLGTNDYAYIAIGGTDITNVKVGSTSIGKTTTGSKSYTGVGFQGDFLLVAGSNFLPTASAYTFNNTAEANAGFVLGAAKSSTERWTVSVASEDARANADTWSYQRGDKCFSYLDNSTGALLAEADFVSFDSDGFTWNYTTNTTANNQNAPFIYMAIKGGRWDVNYLQSPTTNTTVVANTDASSILKGVQFAETSSNLITSTTISSHNRLSVGATDGTNQYVGTLYDTDGSGNMVNVRAYSPSHSIYHIVANATATSSTIPGRASVTFSTTSFTTTWTNTDGTQRYIPYWALSEYALSQVSTTTTHKYNITGKVTQTKTHKYNIIGKITATKTHKYNILQKITATKTHKYNLVTKVTQTKTHKYNIIGKITQTRTHKYNILQKITATKTHKFNILQKITQTKTHKYNIIGKVVRIRTHLYNVIGKVTQTRTHKYNIIAKVTATKTHKYNILQKITRTRTHLFSLLEQVLRTRTHKYNIIGKVVHTKTHKYNIIVKITATKTHVFSIITRLSTTKTHKYNILEQIIRTRTHKFNVSSSIVQVSTTKTHKFNIESPLQQVSTTKTHKYNVVGKVTALKTHVFSVLEQIATTKTHKYNIIGKITTTKTHLFSVIAPVFTNKTHKYDVIGKITTNKTHKYNLAGKVTTTKTHKFDIAGVLTQVTATKTHVFSVIGKITRTRTHKFSILEQIILNKTHKFNLVSKVTQTKSHKFNLLQKITKTTQHLFTLLNAVSPAATKTHKFSILQLAARTRTHKYNVVGRITTTKTHKYSMGGKVLVSKTHRYDVGSGVVLKELGGSTNAYVRFPERVQIIDIISDINNRVYANIEVVTPYPPSNLAIGFVQIKSYADLYKDRSIRSASVISEIVVRSDSILPPVIDSIECLAVAPHIAIEIFEPESNTKIECRSLLLLQQKQAICHVSSQTQIKESEKTKIKIASATMLQQTQLTRIASKAQLEMLVIPKPIIAPEIMTKEKHKILKTLVSLLSSDHLFE